MHLSAIRYVLEFVGLALSDHCSASDGKNKLAIVMHKFSKITLKFQTHSTGMVLCSTVAKKQYKN